MPEPSILERLDRLTLITYNRISKEIDHTLNNCSQIITGARKDIAFDPLTDKRTAKGISKEFEGLSERLKKEIESSITKSWEFGNLTYDDITKNYLLGKSVKQGLKDIYFDHNSGALKAFLERKMNGLNLSERVWNITKLSEQELGLLVEEGLAVGKSAAELSRDVRYILKEPEKRFRRIRNDAGDLVPSKAMKQFHPGQGVYRSSYKNALRLTGSEVNRAYCTSEHYRQQNLDFVVGKEVKLSNNHPEFDICDELKGKYPKDFLFAKWHPKCRCYSTPILMDTESFDQFIETGEMPDLPRVTDIPKKATDYLNTEPFKGWKNDPYFIKDNKKYFVNGLPKPVEVPRPVKQPKGLSIEEAKKAMANFEMTKTEKGAIGIYTAVSYNPINQFHRGIKKGISGTDNLVSNTLSSFLERAPKVSDKTYRGLGLSEYNVDQFVGMLKKDATWVDKGFMSTSYSKEAALEFGTTDRVKCLIEVNGKNGVLVEPFSSMQQEKEVLFNKGSQFKVGNFKVKRDKNGIFTEIFVSLIEL